MTADLLTSKDIALGQVYLVEATMDQDGAVNYDYAFQLFGALVEKYKRGLAITTMPQSTDKLAGVESHWLVAPCVASGNGDIASSLERIVGSVRNSQDETPVILEGLELLETYNGFDSLFRAMTILKGVAARKKCTILIPVNPASFSAIDYNKLKSQAVPRRENKAIGG